MNFYIYQVRLIFLHIFLHISGVTLSSENDTVIEAHLKEKTETYVKTSPVFT